jgi:hypothetical protein
VWERVGGVEPVHLSLDGGESSAWTTNERAAGENQRLLAQDDQMPQVIFSVRPAMENSFVTDPVRDRFSFGWRERTCLTR